MKKIISILMCISLGMMLFGFVEVEGKIVECIGIECDYDDVDAYCLDGEFYDSLNDECIIKGTVGTDGDDGSGGDMGDLGPSSEVCIVMTVDFGGIILHPGSICD